MALAQGGQVGDCYVLHKCSQFRLIQTTSRELDAAFLHKAKRTRETKARTRSTLPFPSQSNVVEEKTSPPYKTTSLPQQVNVRPYYSTWWLPPRATIYLAPLFDTMRMLHSAQHKHETASRQLCGKAHTALLLYPPSDLTCLFCSRKPARYHSK